MSPSKSARTPTSRSAGTRARRRARADTTAQARGLRQRAATGRIFLPSAVTILAICAGLTAVRATKSDNIDLAMILVVAAALLDAIDGRIARLLGATTRIGAELDSLADAINFGVVPAAIVYLHLLGGSDIGWVLTLVYVCAIVLRLARFNILNDDLDDAPGYTRDFFVGVPAPAAALIALLPVGIAQQFGSGWWTSQAAVGVWLVISAYLAVSRVPTASMKSTTKVPSRAIAGLLIVVAICAALLLTYPYILMIGAIAAYLAHIPFAWRNERWVQARPEHWDAPAALRRAERRASQTRRRPAPGRSQARLGLRRPGSTASEETRAP